MAIGTVRRAILVSSNVLYNSLMKMDAIVIGGGIVGLCSAYFYKEKNPNHEVAILEGSPFLGDGNTSRNSGVLHAGIYYKEGSNKHLFCKEGNAIWRDWIKEFDMPVTLCGKYVVATHKSEVDALNALFDQTQKNKISGIEWCSGEDISGFVNIEKAFFSKTTGYIDVPVALKKLELLLISKGVHILRNSYVDSISKKNDHFIVKTKEDDIASERILNCSGHEAVRLRTGLGLTDFNDRFVKGSYLVLKKEFFNKSLIYPVPQVGLVGLGVHTTIDSSGVIRFGPNTTEVSKYDYRTENDSLDKMWPAINALFKTIKKSDLSLDYSGIRTKLIQNGVDYPDFSIGTPIEGYAEAIGIESPGLTSAPAIGKYLANLF